ncbi:MAG: hypothetical protein IJV64_00615, partial [Oscillospiraceae bacterium]|nr:hypothetical protein [Oscillospiraceae bacterium]
TQILALYAFDGQQMRYVCRGNELFERNNLSAYDPVAKTLTVHGSGGATTGINTTYRFNPDGYTTEIVEQYDWDWIGTPEEEFHSIVGDMTLEKLKQRWANQNGANWFHDNLQFTQLTEEGGAAVAAPTQTAAVQSVPPQTAGDERSHYAAYVRDNDFSDQSVFTLYDIDEDGVQELLAIRRPKDNNMDAYMEAYGLVGGQVALLYQSPVTHLAGGPNWRISAMTLDGQRYLSFSFSESSSSPAATYDLMDRQTLRIAHHIDRYAVYFIDEDDNMTLDSYITQVDGVVQERFSNGAIDPDATELVHGFFAPTPGQMSYSQLVNGNA